MTADVFLVRPTLFLLSNFQFSKKREKSNLDEIRQHALQPSMALRLRLELFKVTIYSLFEKVPPPVRTRTHTHGKMETK